MPKNTVNTDNASVSENLGGVVNQGNAPTTADDYQDEKEISGSLDMILSQSRKEDIIIRLRGLLGQVAEGFGDMTKPSDIFKMDQPFYVIGASTIDDYVDTNTGEVKTKHIFRLEFENGLVKNIMQSSARPRAVLAECFVLAAQIGGRLRCGPYKFTEKNTRKPQPALIFSEQQGFQCRPV